MHNRIKLVEDDIFKQLSPIVGDFHMEYIYPFLYISQDVDISQLMGQRLLSRIIDGKANDNLNAEEYILLDQYITPALVHFTMARAMTHMLIKVDNSGLVKRSTETGYSAEMGEVSYLADNEKTVAQSYGKRLKDYLEANKDLYKEYKQEFHGEITVEDTPSFTGGLWLGKRACDTYETRDIDENVISYSGVTDNSAITSQIVAQDGVENEIPVYPIFSPHLKGYVKYGFILVPYRIDKFTKWYESQYNFGEINEFSLFRYQGIVTHQGKAYDVYVTNYPTDMDSIYNFSI